MTLRLCGTASTMLSQDVPTYGCGRRAAHALVALVVAAAVLAAAHDPVQGAAAYAETRRLEGPTRYETAVNIAEAYVDEVERFGGERVDTVVLTSGANDHFAYAMSMSALAQLHRAPLLLVQPNALPPAVGTFLSDNDISEVIIVGGPSVVSATVAGALEALGDIEVTRIADADAYSTAAAVAAAVGESVSPGEFPVDGRTALLATGENFADALAAGPLAYRGNHPILLTRSAELPEATETFLAASGIEHVVILGGGAAVSSGVEQAVADLGIEITRWAGADRFATAVKIAEALLGVDTPADCFGGSEVGLAYGRRSPDAIVSGPLLGELCAPLLLTEWGELPESAAALLRSDDYITGDINGDVRITVFGGEGAVSEQALMDAIDAAQLPELTASLRGVEGGCHFTVEFSEPVQTSDAADFSSYSTGQGRFGTVNAGAGTTTTSATVTFSGGFISPAGTVPAGCFAPLQERERIGISTRAIRAANDDRTVVQSDYVIPPDNRRPSLVISAPQGGDIVWVESTEPLAPAPIEVLFERGSSIEAPVGADLDDGAIRFTVVVPEELGGVLQAGDKVSIASRAAADLAGNESRAASRTVENDDTPPEIDRITVTEPVATRQAAVTLKVADTGGSTADAILISADPGTSVDGAAGNEWQIDVNVRDTRPRGWSPSQLSSVRVSESSRRILVQVLAEAVVDDLAADLNNDRAFNSRFTALAFSGEAFSRPADTRGRVSFTEGASTVDVTVLWSEPVQGCTGLHRAVDPRNIEIDVDADGEGDFALDGHTFGDSDVMLVASDGSGPLIAGDPICDTSVDVRSGTLKVRIESANVDNLPGTASLATIRPGAASDFARNENESQTGVKFRRP